MDDITRRIEIQNALYMLISESATKEEKAKASRWLTDELCDNTPDDGEPDDLSDICPHCGETIPSPVEFCYDFQEAI